MSVEVPCEGRIETTFGVSRVPFLDFDYAFGDSIGGIAPLLRRF
jgi:hypothetical protein